jgi:hypothetical protein
MKLSLVLIPAGLLLAMAAPAMAAPYCNDDRGGISITFGKGLGMDDTEADLNDQDKTELQQRGVDVTRVERWNGCIRAYVRQPDGSEQMEFYDPNNMQRVQ